MAAAFRGGVAGGSSGGVLGVDRRSPESFLLLPRICAESV